MTTRQGTRSLDNLFEKLGDAEVQVHRLSQQRELHTFINPNPERNYRIRLVTDELTSLCPATGHPDFADLTIEYVPDLVCVEMKSLKLYIETFRTEGHFYEELINLIWGDLESVLKPRYLVVHGDFHTRGGWPAGVTVSSQDQDQD
jgi:7-cyano-7-deazaguanine reductase